MKNKVKISVILLAAVSLLLSSCKKTDYSISITTDQTEESIVITAATPLIVKYTINSPTGVVSVKCETSDNISYTHLPYSDKMSGQLILTLVETGENSYAKIIADNGTNKATYTLGLEMETIKREGAEVIDVPAEGQFLSLNVLTNVDFHVIVSKEAADWIILTDSKTIVSKEIKLYIDTNEDVNRSGVVTVTSNNSDEIKTTFTINQAGILNNLIATYTKTSIVAPDILGTNPSGTIYWGDGYKLAWSSGAKHSYTDTASRHDVEIHTKSNSCKFNSLLGVSKVNLVDFQETRN